MGRQSEQSFKTQRNPHRRICLFLVQIFWFYCFILLWQKYWFENFWTKKNNKIKTKQKKRNLNQPLGIIVHKSMKLLTSRICICPYMVIKGSAAKQVNLSLIKPVNPQPPLPGPTMRNWDRYSSQLLAKYQLSYNQPFLPDLPPQQRHSFTLLPQLVDDARWWNLPHRLHDWFAVFGQ